MSDLLKYNTVSAEKAFDGLGERLNRCPFCQSLQIKLLEIKNAKRELYECKTCKELIR